MLMDRRTLLAGIGAVLAAPAGAEPRRLPGESAGGDTPWCRCSVAGEKFLRLPPSTFGVQLTNHGVATLAVQLPDGAIVEVLPGTSRAFAASQAARPTEWLG